MKRMMFISIDGASWEIINPILNEGHLPYLKKLVGSQHSAMLQTHSYVSSGSTWPSIHTGKHPGDHGIMFSHRQMKSGTYHVVKKKASDIPYKAFWQIVSDQGIPVITFDLPKAPMVDHTFNGMVLNSWGEEAPWYSPSFPKNLKQEIHKRFGQSPLQEFYHRPMSTIKEWKQLLADHIYQLTTRFDITDYLLEKEPNWQLFVMAINEIHLAGHLFYHFIDEKNPRYDDHLRNEIGNVFIPLFKIIDQKLEKLADKYPDADFIFISNNGMTTSGQPLNIMDKILKGLGFMHGRIKSEGLDRNSYNFVYELEKRLPLQLITSIKRYAPKYLWANLTRRITHSSKEWKISQAFPLPNDVSGAIRINLKGREPSGIVNQEDYDDLLKDISKHFLSITCNGTTQKAVKEVINVRERFAGKRVNELADLLILWNKEVPIISVEHPLFGSIKVKEDKRSGSHTDQGIYLTSLDNPLKPDPIQDLSLFNQVLDYFNITMNQKLEHVR